MSNEISYRKDPYTSKDYINFGGERVPERNIGYRVEMSFPESSANRADVRLVIPVNSAKKAIKKAKKLYPRMHVTSAREDS